MTENTTQFLSGGGEMGKLIRSMDWSQTALGPIETWPQSLRTTVSLCLSSTFPILIAWGPETIQIYNDSYRPICGAKHPASMGQNFRICWETALPVVGDAFTRGQEGEGTYIKDQRMFLDRYGYLEEAFMTFSFAPIRDESGGVGGIFHPITETTEKMLSARRTQVLRDLAAQIGKAQTVDDICTLAGAHHEDYVTDLPFLLLYKINADSGESTLMTSMGVEKAPMLAPETITPDNDHDKWPLRSVLEGRIQQVDELGNIFGQFECAPYPQAPGTAMLLPIQISGQETPFGFLVAGVSACRAMDPAYLNFYELLNNTFNTAFSNVYAYEQEQKRAAALAEIDRAKTAFFSNVSHEFRTPLTLMLGPLEELLQHDAIKEEPAVLDNIASTHRNAQRLLKLVNNLLDYSRVEVGRVQAFFQPVNLSQLTADLSSSFRAIIEKAGMQLHVECPPMSKQVYADQEMWEKIILNLLSNAFKYTMEGAITVRLSESATEAILQVEDTGTGIPAKELPHMFERFHRVEQAVGRTHEGSGIGLSLVHELVKLHNGDISIESELGKGTCFTIRIPFGRSHLPAAQVSEKEKQIDTNFLKKAFLQEAASLLDNSPSKAEEFAPDLSDGKDVVLVVDDNTDMRQYLTRLLEPYYTVQTATNGQDALHKIRQQPPALVLSDIMMPVMDGKGLLQRLKGDVHTMTIPLIFLSARAGNEARVDGLEDGADDYLVKPFSAKELLTKIKTQIGVARTLSKRTSDLKSANEELLRSNQQLRDFAHISSHDLQEPLRKIQIFADILIKQSQEGTIAPDKYLEKIVASANRMSTLINDLLHFSKLNITSAHTEVTDLNTIVQQVINDFELVIRNRQAVINVSHLPVIKAIPVQMNQLFFNLLSNALKFSTTAPVIHVTANVITAGTHNNIRGLLKNVDYHEIVVKDNGIGFDQQYAERIFTIFQRLVKQTHYEGNGIGLTMCRKIVENHEGMINVTSKPGAGSSFSIYLPVLDGTAAVDPVQN
ncbi:ATP-binding protein [Chitinophaga rhizophila]|uniref:histidine kinase n=1 Tax=Chitinophaga rhizophila TaxID=2866212 RepID=A0ABS7G935_9BACT|nr:ATP-binding protein [Chitinophaga rhizophila]MBW8684172.1 response regulator [Chitinophaga rhizophila]